MEREPSWEPMEWCMKTHHNKEVSGSYTHRTESNHKSSKINKILCDRADRQRAWPELEREKERENGTNNLNENFTHARGEIIKYLLSDKDGDECDEDETCTHADAYTAYLHLILFNFRRFLWFFFCFLGDEVCATFCRFPKTNWKRKKGFLCNVQRCVVCSPR